MLCQIHSFIHSFIHSLGAWAFLVHSRWGDGQSQDLGHIWLSWQGQEICLWTVGKYLHLQIISKQPVNFAVLGWLVLKYSVGSDNLHFFSSFYNLPPTNSLMISFEYKHQKLSSDFRADVIMCCFSTVRPRTLRSVTCHWIPEIKRFVLYSVSSSISFTYIHLLVGTSICRSYMSFYVPFICKEFWKCPHFQVLSRSPSCFGWLPDWPQISLSRWTIHQSWQGTIFQVSI